MSRNLLGFLTAAVLHLRLQEQRRLAPPPPPSPRKPRHVRAARKRARAARRRNR